MGTVAAVMAVVAMAVMAAMVAMKAGVVRAEGTKGVVAAVEAKAVAVKAPEIAARPQTSLLCSQLSPQALQRALAPRRS